MKSEIERIEDLSEYARAPMWILVDTKLTAGEKLLSFMICSLSTLKGYCYASNKTLARYLGTTEDAIVATMQRLRAKEVIKIENKFSKNGTRQLRVIQSFEKEQTVNLTVLAEIQKEQTVNLTEQTVNLTSPTYILNKREIKVPQITFTDSSQETISLDSNTNIQLDDSLSLNTKKSKGAAGIYEPLLAIFWSAYSPFNKDRKKAAIAFYKKDYKQHDQIMLAFESYKAEQEANPWRQWKQPITFLNDFESKLPAKDSNTATPQNSKIAAATSRGISYDPAEMLKDTELRAVKDYIRGIAQGVKSQHENILEAKPKLDKSPTEVVFTNGQRVFDDTQAQLVEAIGGVWMVITELQGADNRFDNLANAAWMKIKQNKEQISA